MSAQADALVLAHARAQKMLTGDLEKRIEAVWDLLDIDNLDATYEAFEAAVMSEVIGNAEKVFNLEVVFLRAYVKTELGINIKPDTSPYNYLTPEKSVAIRGSVRATTVASIKAQTAAGINPQIAATGALTNVKGAAKRHALSPARDLVVDTARNDRRLGYFKRRSIGDTCPFCIALIARGAVYKAETAAFAAHDDCDCVALPAAGGKEVPAEAYIASARKDKRTDVDKERLKAWIEEYK